MGFTKEKSIRMREYEALSSLDEQQPIQLLLTPKPLNNGKDHNTETIRKATVKTAIV